MAAETQVPARRQRERLRARAAAYEAAPVLVVLFAAFVAVGHVADTDWAGTFLFNGDSLVLPLIEKSIQGGEAFEWVFSSQNFLFPEAPIFLLSTLFTDSPAVALITNACLNVVLLYVLLRVIAHLLAHRSRHRFIEIAISVSATVLFVVFVLLEPSATVNRSGIATLFLFSTYYYGVILAGLALVALILWATYSFGTAPWGRDRVILYSLAATTLTALTLFSDPLFAFQVVVPLLGTLLTLVFANRLSWLGLVLLAAGPLLGSALGLLLRRLYSGLFASSLDGYLSLNNIPESIRVLYRSLVEMLSTGQGTFKLLLVGSILAFVLAVFLVGLYAQSRPRLARRIATVEFFVFSFVTLSSLSLVAGMVFTGSTNTRYLEPIFVFPLVAVVATGVYVLRRLLLEVKSAELRNNLSRFAIAIGSVASVLIILLGASTLPSVSRLAEAVYAPADCLEEFVGESDINGLGSFWAVRPLSLYGEQEGSILQAMHDFTAYPWMSNMDSYEGKTFSYVIIDDSGLIVPEDLLTLGEPNRVVSCPGFVIYDYEGTEGERVLTRRIRESVGG